MFLMFTTAEQANNPAQFVKMVNDRKNLLLHHYALCELQKSYFFVHCLL